jgi:hypothetical protein
MDPKRRKQLACMPLLITGQATLDSPWIRRQACHQQHVMLMCNDSIEKKRHQTGHSHFLAAYLVRDDSEILETVLQNPLYLWLFGGVRLIGVGSRKSSCSLIYLLWVTLKKQLRHFLLEKIACIPV